jgi:hypothetical protein
MDNELTWSLADLKQQAGKSASKHFFKQNQPHIKQTIMGVKTSTKQSNERLQPLSKPSVRTGRNGVYIATDKLTGVPTGAYRVALRPTNSTKWHTVGHFINLDTAAYVFNCYALTIGLENLVNHNITPDKQEVAQWRARSVDNANREAQARDKYMTLWGTH